MDNHLLMIHSSIWKALLRCRAVQVLPAKIVNVCELLCLTFRPQFVDQVFLRWWLREYLHCASGIPSQHEQWELPFPLTLQAVLHHPRTVLPSYSAEIVFLSFLTCSALWVEERRKCTKSGSEGCRLWQWNCHFLCAHHCQHLHEFWTHM